MLSLLEFAAYRRAGFAPLLSTNWFGVRGVEVVSQSIWRACSSHYLPSSILLTADHSW